VSRKDGNREEVLASLEMLVSSLVAGEIEREECAKHVREIASKYPWIKTEFDDQDNVNPFERIWAKALGIPPVPGRVPLIGN